MLESSPPISSTPASPDAPPVSENAPDVVIFVEENGGDWHAGRLARALELRGARTVTTTLRRCAFDTVSSTGLRIPGFDGTLPKGAFVRAISTGSLEEITFRLGILHALRESGVRVWNDARAIERSVDKSTTTFFFQRAGLPIPTTRTFEAIQRERYCHGLAPPLVSKPLFGSQGNGVRRLESWSDLPDAATVNGVYHLQEYLPPHRPDSFEDWRLFVSGGRLVAGMTRRSTQWVTNVHQGAEPTALKPDVRTAELAIAAAAAVGADYAGVDIMRTENDKLFLLEINSNPAWKGLQGVTDVDVAQCLADDFLAAVMPTLIK
ncbi:Alpha-L-glutamate ligase [Candidatus Filomicrobium marinum]|uniref:Alpha-L-glutamate ligase n=2 Tax=Filomicrobium TaxID=119044 RepID=A0A0D6JAY7_9HYPH|nr:MULTISPECIES: ATP-grasp domain-containing protein [Filomicrobium]CFX04075.1 Alpha-L-glutamate ligase [Candidatus Filomicrobium marinum]CPR15968.1 Alpha-L-glutamate ligase [Candidatus Filomicrobium marinum]SDP43131.1 SSU ribosomal protein S6P modification protein [Filomicrobium insigne]